MSFLCRWLPDDPGEWIADHPYTFHLMFWGAVTSFLAAGYAFGGNGG